MFRVSLVNDLDECRRLWERTFPAQFLTDLWEVRACFQQSFRRPPCFVVARDFRGICGLLPLSWIEEAGAYGYFPGETWEGRTWLEQNRVHAANSFVLDSMLKAVPGPYQLRYLLPDGLPAAQEWIVDEIGYHFRPDQYGFDLEAYFRAFSHRTAKRLKREIAAFEERGLTWRFDDLSDYDHLVRLNVERFGERSYFSDPRFADGFRNLRQLAASRGWLRMTSVLLGGEHAAVDLGCVYGDTYTLMAGGTHVGYPGVAKLINLHHMAYACQERFRLVDFLCGNFSWKEMFHLTPRPLYLMADPTRKPAPVRLPAPGRPAYVV
jgi:hypothetical protein